MPTTSDVLDALGPIALPSSFGAHYAEELWGAGQQYRIDPWVQQAEQTFIPMILDRTRYSFGMLNLPPQVGKSSWSTELLPFWLLGLYPDLHVIVITYSDDYSRTKGKTVRNMMERYGPKHFGVSVDQENQSAGDWTIAGHRGGMLSVGIGSQITGRPGDVIIIDDIIKNSEEAGSPTVKRKHMLEYQNTIRTRLQPGGTILITATRWAEDDLSGSLQDLQNQPDYERDRNDFYEVLSFPAIAEIPDDYVGEPEEWRDRLGRRDGQPLQCRFTRDDEPWEDNPFYRIRRSAPDPVAYSCLYQQSPTVREGGMFPRGMWKHFDPADFPYMVEKVRVWDLAATKGGGDYTVGALVGKDMDGEWYVLDIKRDRLGASEVRELVRRTAREDGFGVKIRLEESRDGAGKSVVEFYKEDIELRAFDVDGVRAEGQKWLRAGPYSTLQMAGHFHLPDGAPWLKDFVDEHKQAMDAFRWPKHDDQIDVVAYAVLEMHDSNRVTVVDSRSYRPENNDAVKEMARRMGLRVVA